MKTADLENYLRLTENLLAWRVDHEEDTAEEDNLLDVMDRAWDLMSDEETEWLNATIFKTPV